MKSRFLTLVLIAAIALSVVTAVYAEPGSKPAVKEEITIKAEIGFNGLYKIGYAAPLNLEVENKLKDIHGEIQVEMPNDNNTAVLYSIDVSLPANSTKTITMDLPMMRYTNSLEIKILDGKDVVATKKLRINPGANAEIYAIGLLSDDYEGIKYINKAPLRSGVNFNTTTNTIKLSENNFPRSLDTAKLFNTIVINNFDTSKLDGKQYEALKKWVRDGGMLLIGTGSAYNKTLSIFKDDFLKGKAGEVSLISTKALSQFLKSNSSAEMKLNALDIELEGAKSILGEKAHGLVQMLERDRGTIGLVSFDLGMEPMVGWDLNGKFMEALMGRLLPSFYSSVYYQKDMMMRQNGYAMDGSLRNIPELAMPKTSYMFIIYGIYILLVAPIAYLILKKLDKRELMWIVVPVFSILFSAGLYIAGFGTRLTEPIVNIISLAEVNEKGSFTPVTYAGVFTPVKTNIKVEAGEGMALRVNTNVVDYGYYGHRQPEKAPRRVLSKITLAPKTAIEFYQNQVWSMKTVVLDHESSMSGSLDAKLNYAGKSVKGTIVNQTGFDWSEGFIVTPNQVFKVGAVKNGETLSIDEKAVAYAGNRYELMNVLYKDPHSMPRQAGKQTKFTEAQIQEFKYNLQKRQVLDFAYWENTTSGESAKLLAWSNTPAAKDVYVNGKKTKVIEKTLLTADVKLNFRNGKTVEYPLGYIKPVIFNNMDGGHYDEYGKAFYGRGSFELHYVVDGDIQVEDVSIQYNTGVNTKQFMWNAEKNEWVEGKYTNYKINKTSVSKYFDRNNTLKFKFELNDDHLQLPQIYLKGSVK